MTATDTLSVTFAILLGKGREVTEDALPDVITSEPGSFDVSYQQEGRLYITAGEAIYVAEDPLFFMIPSLCFDAVVKLTAGKSIPYASWSSPEKISLDVTGDTITISGEDMDPQSFARDDLLKALLAAGQRFRTSAAQIWPADSEEDRNSLGPRAETAKAALS